MRAYEVIVVKQRDSSPIEMVIFTAAAKEVYAWSQADDIRIDSGNVQRELINSRWRQVSKFFNANPVNVIPTSVTVAFDEAATAVNTVDDLAANPAGYHLERRGAGAATLRFNDGIKASAFIIDGQHRLKGMSELAEEIKVPVCLLLSISRLERAFQFVTINNKSHKVPTDNLKALIHNFDAIEEPLRVRLSAATITAPRFATHIDVMNENVDSPFHKMVDWVNNRHAVPEAKRCIAPAAIENSLRAITSGFPETKADASDSITVLSAIWRAIYGEYGITFDNIETFPNITKKPVIQRVTEMVVDHLVRMLDPAFSTGNITSDDARQAADAARKLVAQVPVVFWQEAWPMKGLDTSAGRDLIAEGIRALKLNIEKSKGKDDPNFDWRKGNPLYIQAPDLPGDED